MAKYALGLDYGSLSVRALIMNIETGEEVGVSVFKYPHGIMDSEIPTGRKLASNFALQHPQDYLEGLEYVVKTVMQHSSVTPEEIVGIGVDFTASTVLPVRADGCPLCILEEFKDEPHAYVKLWKHHGAEEEANYINKIAKERNEEWLSCFGGSVSSEWMIPKVLETLHDAPSVYEKAERYIEAMDWIVWQLTGKETRSLHGLRYKSLYNHKTEQPSKEFFSALDSRMENFIEEKMNAPIKQLGEVAGYLTEEMAKKLGLLPETPIGTAMIDGPACVLGGGVTTPGEMMIVVGTSVCHFVLSEEEKDVYGISAVVKDGIIPGYYSYDAGQSGGGDHFAWVVKNCVPERYEIEAKERGMDVQQLLSEKLKDYRAGQSGLLALDWFNGVRSPLKDCDLTGLILGMNLSTKPEEIYMALIEATAYGTKAIVEEYEKAGIVVETILLSGGIPLKNPMLVQVYTDVLNREVRVCKTTQAGARGAAMLGVAAADSTITGYQSLEEIAQMIGNTGDIAYYPNKNNAEIYEKLYEEYMNLQEYFGKGKNDVLKRLIKMKNM